MSNIQPFKESDLGKQIWWVDNGKVLSGEVRRIPLGLCVWVYSESWYIITMEWEWKYVS